MSQIGNKPPGLALAAADQYVVSGSGIAADPYIGWETTIPKGSCEVHFTPGKVYGVTSTNGLQIGLGQDNTRYYGHGAMVKYAGSGTAASLVNFTAPTNTLAALDRCSFIGFDLDPTGVGTNQCQTALLARSSHHMTVDAVVLNGGTVGTDAAVMLACTKPVWKLVIDGGSNPGATNFTRGLVVDGLFHSIYGYVLTTVGAFDIHVNKMKGNTLDINGIFSCNFVGAAENSITGWGVVCGSATADVDFIGFDFEGSGPIGFNGGHQAVWIKNGAKGLNFIGAKSFDGFMQVDATAAHVTVIGGDWFGMTNSSNLGITLIGASGMDPTVGNFGGVTDGVRILARVNGNPDQIPSTIIKNTAASFSIENTDVAGASAFYSIKSDRTGHVQEWQFVTGLQDFNALCFRDVTGNTVPLELKEGGDIIVGSAAKKIGFFAGGGAVKPTVTGSKGANAALTSLMTAMSALGLVTDTTT